MAGSRRGFLKAIGLGALGMAMPVQRSAGAEDSQDKSNILVILADDLGYGDLSCYGATDLQSPHIDRLVGRGMRFENFYANCPVCSPTRAASGRRCAPSGPAGSSPDREATMWR